MRLLTNENNTNALKIIIASKIAKKSLVIQNVALETLDLKTLKALPQLDLGSGVRIFSSNSAAKLLLRPEEREDLVNYFLDLEASVIQPLIAAFGCKGGNDKNNLEKILGEINHELKTKQFLTGDSITVADISLWSTLYSLFTNTKIFQQFFCKNDALMTWFDKMHKHPAIQDALKLYSCSTTNLMSFHSQKSSSGATGFQKFSSNPSDKVAKDSNATVTAEEKKAAELAWNTTITRSFKTQAHPVLPVPGERNVLVTSALPYVNNVPHLGNIIGCVLSGDVFARYCRLKGYNTLYICGTDEYGTATETKALEEKLTPREICDKYFTIHDHIYKWFNINFDYFGRTTTSEQKEIVQDIFLKVYKNGYIVSNSVEQLLCEECDRYLADRFVEGICPRCAYDDARGDQCDGCGHLINAPELIKPRCKMCQQTPILKQSKQFFLDLPQITPVLKEWMEKSSKNWSHNAREISKAWLNDGLKPRCITRDLKWGIPVPLEGFENKVFYVWFDAPIGYISITRSYTKDWKKWWLPEENTQVNLYQFMAKDNVPFHSVMFPASLLATQENYVLVDNIFATEYLNYEDGKFSKSRGIGVFGNDAQDTGIPADIWRFYLLYVRPESQDASFSWLDLGLKNNSELLNVLGNFINRGLMFCEKNYDSIVPKINLLDEDYELIALVNRELAEYISALEKGKLREGIRHLLSVARLGNQFLQSSEFWVLCKSADDCDKKRCETVIGLSINLSCLLALLLDPYMPETSNTIKKQLNSPPEINNIEDKFRLLLPPGHKIGKPFPLFDKIDEDQIAKLKAQFSGRQKMSPVKESVDKIVNDVPSLEAAIAAQGDIVRKMKAAGKDKSEWGPEVTILLDLKKRLSEAQAKSVAPTPQEIDNSGEKKSIKEMEDAVTKQGDKVRKLKETGADKAVWQPEVTILLELKKQLAELKGEPLPPPSGKKNKKK